MRHFSHRAAGLALALLLLLPLPAGAEGAQPAQNPTPTSPGYLLFFHGDAAELTPHAHLVIVKAAQRARQLAEARRLDHIKVIGYSDAVSSPDAARELSLRRAETIRDTLLSHGMAADRITVEGRGRTRPVLKPGEEAREQGNRRARIVIYQRPYYP